MHLNDLKSQIRDAEDRYAKATKCEFSRQYDNAFEHYVRAAELFLDLSRLNTQSEKDRIKWKGNLQKCLDRAERIKAFTQTRTRVSTNEGSSIDGNGRSTHNVQLTPVVIDQFAKHEQCYVLRKGSSVNGLVFPLWDESSGPMESETLFVDPDGQPKLSQEQMAVSPIWKRPMHYFKGFDDSTPRIMPHDIRQHIVTDCSVCASISVSLEHGRRFGSFIAESPMHHYCQCERLMKNELASKLFFSQKSGRFDFKVLFNGAWRRIVIDDQLPRDPRDGTLMCMSISADTKSPFTIWPSLLEKAYMKLMGGYDFPGSNSSIDLHAIAGWIPEHVEIHRPEFERERTWERLLAGFSSGRCMLTLGTGPKPTTLDPRLKLLPSHSYAVIDVFDSDEGRHFTVLDSWVQDQDADDRSRRLDIRWTDALNMFDGIYLSWDPAMWDHQIQVHGMWKRQDIDDVTRQLFVTFSNTNEEEGEILVLLTRHASNTRRTNDFIALRVQLEDDINGAVAFNQQTKCMKETYTNSMHILQRLRLKSCERSGIISILASYDGDATEVGFTLSVYAGRNTTIAWDESFRTPPYSHKVEGNFTLRTAGGNCTHPTFMINPQYRLIVFPPKANRKRSLSPGTKHGSTTITLQSSKDTPVNIAIVRSQEHRVSELAERDLVATSGPYTYGMAKISKDVPPGEFTVVVSAFNPENIGPFTLKVESMLPIELKAIPQEGAGMYSTTKMGAWDESTAGGGPTFNSFGLNPKYELDVPSTTKLRIRLQVTGSSKSVPINVTVYLASKPGADLSKVRHVGTSGPYDEALAGVATPEMTLGPAKYWVIPSTYHRGVQGEFKLIVYHSASAIKLSLLGSPR
ncbi:cysteine proteinase [Coprinopsis marcescibilis]|uniref:Cysteine proteinase n=1 Tax=Coprinopsis marcescibilis TaxID=230819 RepID=A0A5C3KQ09_COPMA|nr:cysteine proteinase [Coprinopsis marcescibilis]